MTIDFQYWKYIKDFEINSNSFEQMFTLIFMSYCITNIKCTFQFILLQYETFFVSILWYNPKYNFLKMLEVTLQ